MEPGTPPPAPVQPVTGDATGADADGAHEITPAYQVLVVEVRDVARRVAELVDLGTEYREAAAERAVRLTVLVNEAADLRTAAQEQARAAAASRADVLRLEGRHGQVEEARRRAEQRGDRLEAEVRAATSAADAAATDLAAVRSELGRLRSVERRAVRAEAALASLRRRRSVRAALFAASSAGRVLGVVRR